MVQDTLHRSLRSEIEKEMKAYGYTISKTAELTGMNPGHLSEILNSNPPRAITIYQLDAFATAFGKEEGWLYELYPEECMSGDKITKRRLIPYLVRCAEIECHECLELITSQLLDNPKHLSILFSVAEKLYDSSRADKAIPFYEYVIENEKDSFSSQFIMSQYRLFRIKIGTNSEENYKALIRFEPYRKRLPENYQLDALLQLANVCYTLKEWEELEKYADELRSLSEIVYKEEVRKLTLNKVQEPFVTERHLVVYYGQSYLLKTVALMQHEQYEEAKKYVQKYIDLGWFKILDDVGKQEVEKFRIWGEAYLYSLDLMLGNREALYQYVKFLEAHPNEILSGLLSIMEAASKHDFPLDEILEKFADQIAHFGDDNNSVTLSQKYNFFMYKSEYNFKKGHTIVAIDELLQCMELSIIINNHEGFRSSVAQFWKYHNVATARQKNCFQSILEGV
ncbi:helix-turn-helix domain-containing protein [Caldalkalibacillus mannanilyticus]|uniref:helix-turn-helix domain-containing protein n=1 Tax=Caldalkalibacillus mannanilyticus TaxID=1418 RepID=UPI00046A40E2|nr:helix-turn-helix transcriptional regulator [Caldalkalibacillus mannanilyticus]